MLTEEEARDLLRRAGQTIEVDPTKPVPVVAEPRNRWLVLGAAASVAAISIASWAVLSNDGHEPDPGPTVTAPTNGIPPGGVPSVFGYDRESATAMLEGLGFRVSIEEKQYCEVPGRAIGTIPATGTVVEPGGTVTVQVATTGAARDCFFGPSREEAWAFVDFANGRAPAPSFAEGVTLVVDGGTPVLISSEDAADPEMWGMPSALTELRGASRQVISATTDDNTEYQTPQLGTRFGTPPQENCGAPRPRGVGDREALTLTVDIPVDGVFHCPTTVALYSTNGEIDTVVTYPDKPLSAALIRVPDVTGLDLDRARDMVTAAGFTVVEDHKPTCAPASGVVEQAPQSGSTGPEGQPVTLVTEVLDPGRDCAGLLKAAHQLVSFAHGGEFIPNWADQVDLYLGYAFQKSVIGAAASQSETWDMCTPYAGRSCPMSALQPLAQPGAVRYSVDVPTYPCLEDIGGLRSGLDSSGWMVIHPADVHNCLDQWVVQLWVDSEGRTKAVNLLLGSP